MKPRKLDPISIHPGVKDGRRVHALSKTSKPVNGQPKAKLARKLKVLNMRQVACSATHKSVGPANAPTYTMPGSMKGH